MACAISFGRFRVNGLWAPAEAAAQHPLWWELLGWSGALLVGLTGFRLAQALPRSFPGLSEPRSGGARWALWLPVFVAIIVLLAFCRAAPTRRRHAR